MPFWDLHLHILILLAILWGHREQHIYRNGYADKTYHLFGKLSVRYHFNLWASWLLICYGLGYWYLTPLFAMIEDMAYFAFHPADWLGPEDWINMGLGGFRCFGKWVPSVYIIAVLSTCLLYWVS